MCPAVLGHGDDLLFQHSLRASVLAGLLLTAGTGLRAHGATLVVTDLAELLAAGA